MPVIGHQLVSQQPHLVPFQPFRKNSFERFVVLIFAEDRPARIPAIEGMIQGTGFIYARWSWHGRSLSHLRPAINDS